MELTEGPLHDAKGHLIETGWAPTERRKYARDAVRAPWYRIKEWDYYCVIGEEYGVSFVVADNGYMGLLSVTWLDFTAPETTAELRVLMFPCGRTEMPESADVGNIAITHKGMKLDFRHVSGGRQLMLDCPSFDGGKGLSGELFLEQPPMDCMVIATPFDHNPNAFYYNQKINCMPASGEIVLAERPYKFAPDEHFGVLDWGRGVWAYDNQWYWGSASGLVEGRSFGFNIGYGFGNTSAASENPTDIPRFRELDVVANFQPLWALPDEYITELTVPRLGPERSRWLYPIGSVLEAGGMIAFGSDWYVTTPNPFSQIETAVTRQDAYGVVEGVLEPSERIGLHDAISAFTINAAFVNFQNETTGSIEVGKLADLIVGDKNLFEIDPQEISEARVELTLFGGRVVHGDLDDLSR